MSDRPTLRHCPDLLRHARRPTRPVMVGHVGIGGANPVRVQSMITSDTRDTAACVKEVLELAAAGCEIVRITAQTKVYAANLEHIARGVRQAGCQVPLVADIHFKPDAALEAAKWVEKIRVNPGNYADKKKFEVREYSDADYARELDRIRDEFVPLVRLCKRLGRAMRIGTNHGSLSDRIMNRHGDSPLGMVESALEFARIARDEGYHDFVFSMKASNPKVMIAAYRLLVARLDAEGPDWNYPIHLGVTEAGDGEDGRIKSAIGIGSLLADGIGDTIRVSLTEDSVHEIPVAQALIAQVAARPHATTPPSPGACATPSPGACATPSPGACATPSPSGWGILPQAVGGTSCPASPSLDDDAATIIPDWQLLERHTSSFLPHWRVPGATYAVTFRLADSLPAELHQSYLRELAELERQIPFLEQQSGSRSCLEQLLDIRQRISGLYHEKIGAALDRGHGSCALKDPRIAELVANALLHFANQRYRLFAWCVMPNHVHAVLQPLPGHELHQILHSWKSFTARKANEILGRQGIFWQAEAYDHVVRDADDFRGQVRYVLTNPEKARLHGWTWVGSAYGRNWLEAGGAECPAHGLGQNAPATIASRSTSTSTSTTTTSSSTTTGSTTGITSILTTDTGSTTGSTTPTPVPSPSFPSATPELPFVPSFDPFSYERRRSAILTVLGHELGGDRPVRVCTTLAAWNALVPRFARLGEYRPELILEKSGAIAVDPRDDEALARLNSRPEPCLLTVADGIGLDPVHAFRLLAARADARHPLLLKDTLHPATEETSDPLPSLLHAARVVGGLLCDGIGDAVLVRGEPAPGASVRLAYNILQAAGARIFKTDYVACPSCGRTLFNLQSTTHKIRQATGHLKGVRIAVMGCIVNGPGEMADADFGYVGGAPGKINLYVGKTAVRFNIPEDQAVERLIDLIREHGKWVDAPAPASA